MKLVFNHLSLSSKRTSRHLFHEDLDVSILRNGAQILNNVPVLQVLVEGNLFMKGLGVPNSHREKQTEPKRNTFFPLSIQIKLGITCYSIKLLHILIFLQNYQAQKKQVLRQRTFINTQDLTFTIPCPIIQTSGVKLLFRLLPKTICSEFNISPTLFQLTVH